MLIIAMQVSTHFHSRQRDGSNNRRPFCENPHKPVFHLMITAFVITASAFPGMDKTLSRRVTYGSPVCNVVLHVHVSLLDMHMSYCSTCACKTMLLTGEGRFTLLREELSTVSITCSARVRGLICLSLYATGSAIQCAHCRRHQKIPAR